MDAFWIVTIFLFGACVGSFLNVVIYRVPRGQSIVFPGSHCPGCGRAIRWYDNVPLLSWLVLRGRCRFCKNSISPRYIIVEAVTAVLVVGLYVAYFMLHVRDGLTDSAGPVPLAGAWPMFIAHAALLCGLLVCSAVDIEMWIVPLEVTWVISLVGLLAATAAPPVYVTLMPAISSTTSAVALAGGLGLLVALILMKRGYLKPSFIDAVDAPIDLPAAPTAQAKPHSDGKKARKARKAALKARMAKESSGDGERAETKPAVPKSVAMTSAHGVNPRVEMLREVLFLAPAFVLALAAAMVLHYVPSAREAWGSWFDPVECPSVAPRLAGASSSIFGFLIGGLWVWGIRILGTLAFGKEAMGMGDVHLMACVGAVTGWIVPSGAFFVAPFLALAWGIGGYIRRKQRELPYGPWLAIASVLVMMCYDVVASVFHLYGQTLNFLLFGGQ